MPFFVDVILPLPIPKLFTYLVTEEEYDFIQPGIRIVVPFGNKKKYTALSHRTHQNTPLYEAKSIEYIIDQQAVVSSRQLELWEWISHYYMSPLGSVFRTAVPSILLLESETELHFYRSCTDDIKLSTGAAQLLNALEQYGKLNLSDVVKLELSKSPYKLAQELLNQDLIHVREEVYTKFRPKQQKQLALVSSYKSESALRGLLKEIDRYPKQREILLQLIQLQTSIQKSEFLRMPGVSKSAVETLIKKGVLNQQTVVVDRLAAKKEAETPLQALSNSQQQALASLRDDRNQTDRFLLHGVTASGKTEVYMHLINEVIQQGKQVLFLVPEIALTTQIIQRLYVHFGKRMAVYHSRYTPSERVEVWNKVLAQNPSAQLIVGARSAVLLPFSNLGLIIVDESHEVAYKQFESNPRYHARDAAVVLASLHQAKIVMGSASPSIESTHNSHIGKYNLVEIKERYRGFSMPEIKLVDLKLSQKKKQMKGHFSQTLIDAISKTLEAKEQVILFQNRRGFSSFVNCTACGQVPQCPSCDVSLTYHKQNEKLKCHYCGYNVLSHAHCVACGTAHPKPMGLGTQQIETEIQQLFPDARVGRMDSDTTKGKHGHRDLINRFAQHDFDILVGTQMLTKGLDFGRVTLVGVVLADGLLNFQDFRAHERAFQMLLQVSGRAGRKDRMGLVLIQTYDNNHLVLQQLQQYDYDSMFSVQLKQREEFHYPPFMRLIRFELKHKNFSALQEAANWFSQALHNQFPQVLGPQSPPVGRIRNQFLIQILLKLPASQSAAPAKEQLMRICKRFEQIPAFRSVKLAIDIDPI
jgi:primosomal protein N' (replication factor Y) (superfamily II helicase)